MANGFKHRNLKYKNILKILDLILVHYSYHSWYCVTQSVYVKACWRTLVSAALSRASKVAIEYSEGCSCQNTFSVPNKVLWYTLVHKYIDLEPKYWDEGLLLPTWNSHILSVLYFQWAFLIADADFTWCSHITLELWCNLLKVTAARTQAQASLALLSLRWKLKGREPHGFQSVMASLLEELLHPREHLTLDPESLIVPQLLVFVVGWGWELPSLYTNNRLTKQQDRIASIPSDVFNWCVPYILPISSSERNGVNGEGSLHPLHDIFQGTKTGEHGWSGVLMKRTSK